ncbi:hypothetical protein M422DRAFT_780052 [Sphaerobolus stellatus SS14]|uniref:Rho-GAP domain-containing protein n=1 Tax=Sphaerobolus stellatus (strain SS14) TaxID=990650 RepID=A0A0C9VVC6_SPHS4|nr:hypothetical protein M422DRAFT_780052 [Sphaerobolus stellatus SS14]
MDRLQSAVTLSLRVTETCTAAAEVIDLGESSSNESVRRVLAVITHGYPNGTDSGENSNAEVSDKEEGCLFLMRYDNNSSTELYPHLLFPINLDLNVSLRQRSGGDAPAEFEVTIRIPKGKTVISSREMHSLSAVLEETRRLKAIQDPNSSLVLPTSPKSPTGPSSTIAKSRFLEHDPVDGDNDEFEGHWEWLHFYLSRRFSRLLSFRQPKPRDIRFHTKGFKLSEASAGMPVDEDGDIINLRDQWVYERLLEHKEEYSSQRSISLRIGTFNVNGKLPSQSLASWVLGRTKKVSLDENSPKQPTMPTDEKDSIEHESHPISDSASVVTSTSFSKSALNTPDAHTLTSSFPSTPGLLEDPSELSDIFVFGFQEVDLSTEGLLYRASSTRDDAWTAAIFQALGKASDNYVKLTSKQLAGTLIIIIIKKELRSLVKEISASTAAVGLLGFIANKGAAAVRLLINSTTVTFVCSHLAAFDEYVERRNSDFAEVARKLDFPITPRGTRSMRVLSANVWESDMVFWLGDLNYRIDLPDNEIRTMLSPEQRELDTLLDFDQLMNAIRYQNAFFGFSEHDIDFLPTYRFSDLPRDNIGYDMKRKPAWTDRILHMSANAKAIEQSTYQGHHDIDMSDHRPVSADFTVSIDDSDERKYHRTLKSIFRSLGDFEDSEEAPSVKILDESEINMGDIIYGRSVTRNIRIQNTGKNACGFRFIPLEPGEPICKEWLNVKPLNGLLLPGETTSIEITVIIDERTASFLNHGNPSISENLVLHLLRGTDHIFSLIGSYKKTCFANSLSRLVRTRGPVRTKGDEPLLPEVNALSAPRELMFLVEWLMTNGLDVPDIFLEPGNEDLIGIIREHLDTQPLDNTVTIQFPTMASHRDITLAFGGALLQFLGSLTEPVIPWAIHSRCALVQDREGVFEVLDEVPSFSRNVFVTVTAFLHFIAQSGGEDTSAQLARVFANVLLKDNPRATPGIPLLTPLQKRQFLLLTIG